MSEMRRAARRLVEPIVETFESRHGLDESRARLEAALAKVPAAERAGFTPHWGGEPQRPVLEARFAPSRGTLRFLQGLSLAMASLVGVTVWALATGAPRVFAYIAATWTVLAILGFPFLVLGLASAKDAREARIRKAIRVALLDEEERLPPPQRWPDED